MNATGFLVRTNVVKLSEIAGELDMSFVGQIGLPTNHHAILDMLSSKHPGLCSFVGTYLVNNFANFLVEFW